MCVTTAGFRVATEIMKDAVDRGVYIRILCHVTADFSSMRVHYTLF